MPEAKPFAPSALWGHIEPGVFGAAAQDGPAVRLSERRPGAMLQVCAGAGEAAPEALLSRLGITAMPESNRALNSAGFTVMWSGPGRWLLASHEDAGLDFDNLRAGIESAGGALTDLSHARSVIRVAGDRAVDVLFKGCPLDLETFGQDACTATLLSHVSVQLHRASDECFDIYVFRSFGLSLWEWLLDASLEFGVEVIAPQSD